MVSKEVVEKARRHIAVSGRYENQDLRRVKDNRYLRKDWTPAQKRRMKKKLKTKHFPYDS